MKILSQVIVTALLTIFLTNADGQTFLTNGLVAYYPFNGNAKDASGNGNDGIVQGATLTTDRFGVPNSAYYFDGVSSGIKIPDTLLDPVVDGFTFSAWVGTDSSPYTGTYTILHTGTDAGEAVMQIISGENAFGPVLNTHTGYYVSSPANANSVTHVVGVYIKGQNISIYTNGALANIVPIPDGTLWLEPDYPLYSAIGVYDFAPSPYLNFRGELDDIRIYSRALSSSEVAELYADESFCSPHAADATAIVTNGFVVGATITDNGCGYTNAPFVLIEGGGGSNATATTTIQDGIVTSINIINPGAGYTNLPAILIGSPPFVPGITINVSRVNVTQHVVLGFNYVLESSPDMVNWTAAGPPFIAQSEEITTEFVVNQTRQFFRIRQVP